jgi:hypothetical protein
MRPNLALLAIATIFYAWRDVYLPRVRAREKMIERVALLLFAAANIGGGY